MPLNITSTRSNTNDVQLRYARFGFTTMEASKASSGFESFYVLDGLESKMDLSVGITVPGDLRLDMRMSRQDRLGGYRDFDTGGEVDFEPFSIASCTASRMFADNQIRAFVRVDNLMNKSYRDIGGVEQPGRWFRMGFAYQMR